ncbi:MAG: HEAT repeat domain-containing protein [Pirellulales bacterium]
MNSIRRITRFAVVVAATIATGALAQAADSENAAKEKELIAKLRSDAPAADKAIACKQLAVYGTAQAVGDLGKLLADEQLASWSRIALEAIPGPEAASALRSALGSVEGRLLIGTINSIGVRRDESSVEPLIAHLRAPDAEVASAAAVALGRIGNAPATKTLRESLAGTPMKVRTAVAEGCILCAERLMAAGKSTEAMEIYDEVRRADLPKQKVIEATRGAILARKADGIPLLIEQLRSADVVLFRLGLTTARELPGREVADALIAEVVGATPDRAALLLTAFADRDDSAVTPAVFEVAKSGPQGVRIAAVGVIGRLGDASSLSALLEIATEADAEVAQAAKAALAGLGGEQTNAEIVAQLSQADGKALPVLIEVVGQRRIDATAPLVKAIQHPNAVVRGAALTALGATVGPKELPVLVSEVVAPKHSEDAEVARKALRAACVRMPDREACAEELVAALDQAPAATRPLLLEVLGEVGGAKALTTIGAAVKGNNEQLQDTGSRVLGEWMTLDAAPVLLDLAKTAPDEKYRGRALRGYLRLARQFAQSDQQRAEMCRQALGVSDRVADQQLVLNVLERYPSPDTLQVAIAAGQKPALKADATRAALVLIQKLGSKAGNVRELLAKLDLEPVKVEIIKAEYGAGGTQKDVTAALQQLVGNLPLIALPSPSYSASFGGDPVPGTVKQLKVQYRINGKAGEASFAEDSVVMLPMPK